MEGHFGANLRPLVEKQRGFKRFGSTNAYLQVYGETENLRYQTSRPIHEALLAKLSSR